MLQVERSLNPTMHASRIYRGVPKPSVDFLARNRRALKRKPKPVESTVTVKPKPKARPPESSRRPQSKKQRTTDPNTVVISKSYLEDLLRMSYEPTNQNTVKHVELDSSQVPGLTTSQLPTREPPATTQPAPVTTVQPLSAKEQWLQDLSKQVQEKKGKKNRQQKEHVSEEAYFPFGRPGCGAPIRTDSGKVVADLRSKVRSSYEGPVQSPPARRNQQRVHTPPTNEDYFQFGRPGCGAPIRNESGSVVADLRTKAVANSTVGPLTNTHTKVKHDEPQVQEDYFPFGRPGCGAPIRNESGSVVADLRTKPSSTHKPHNPNRPPVSHAPRAPTQVSPGRGADPASDGFGRGAGPYVDKYVLQERDQKKKKDLEYRAYLAEQIAAREREKAAIRLAKEESEAIEAARIAKERDDLKYQYRKEMAERRIKEEQAIQRQRLLQQGIEEAHQSALKAKLDAKHGPQPTLSTHSPSHTTHTVHKSGDTTSSLTLSSKFDSVLRSPSMLQIAGPTQVNKVSRIPVRSSSIKQLKRNEPKQTPRRQVIKRHPVRAPSPPIPTLAKQRTEAAYISPPSPPIPTLAKQRTEAAYISPPSPPIPTLAKKMSQPPYIVETKPPPLDRVRPSSPPVPTLAKKLSHQSIQSNQPLTSVDSQIAINRQPSCELVRDGSSHTLPAIVMTTNNHYDNQKLTRAPSRQQVILEQLAALKKGILSHQSTIDQRVHVIMTRKKANF